MMAEPIRMADQEARTMAQTAIHKIEAHEGVCEVRWREAYATMQEIKAGLRSNTAHMWAAQASVIAVLLGAVAWLATRALP
jgi:hypothetical protein